MSCYDANKTDRFYDIIIKGYSTLFIEGLYKQRIFNSRDRT